MKRPSPPRFQRQKDGDFPVQVRPYKLYEVRDLQDSSLDAEAAEEDHMPKVKPHKVREAVRAMEPEPLAGARGDTLKFSDQYSRRSETAAQIPHFSYEKDLSEDDAAELAARKARAQAKRNYKWMPNPYSDRPGPLGTSPVAEAKYYERYFDGQSPPEDQRSAAVGDEEYRDPKSPKPKRERIPSRKFWYKPDYVTPDPHSVALMRSRELKFAMVNEAHLVRTWRNDQPEGRAAGLPPNGEDLWMAFGYRAAELATGRPSSQSWQPGGGDAASSGGGGGGSSSSSAPASANASADPEAKQKPEQKCSLLSALRFIQDLASVQAGPFSALQQILGRILDSAQELKPHHCYILLQSMSRLRLRHPKAGSILERMSVAWMLLPPKKFVRAANAVAKLDLGNNIWARPLKATLLRLLPRLSGPHLALLKAIAVMELLDDPVAMQSYLEQCERTRANHVYPRHLQMIELHVHLLYPELWAGLDEDLKLFLQEVRNAGEQSRAEGGYGPGAARAQQSDSEESDGSDADSDGEAARPSMPSKRSSFDKQRFSSELHQDLSRALRELLGVEHQNLVAAGPLTLDVCHLPTMTVVEAGARWQYYLRSPRLTSLARRRQELIRAMDFRLVHVPYHRWEMLETDTEKVAYLRKRLPSEVLAARRADDASDGARGSPGHDGQRRAHA